MTVQNDNRRFLREDTLNMFEKTVSKIFQFWNIKKIKLSKSEINSAADELEFYTLVDAKFRKIIKEQNENFIFAKAGFSMLIGQFNRPIESFGLWMWNL